MIKKYFNILNLFLAFLLPIVTINMILSKSDPNTFFPFIYLCLGCIETFLGINLLNENKKILSFSSFLLASFLFIIVGAKIYIYN